MEDTELIVEFSDSENKKLTRKDIGKQVTYSQLRKGDIIFVKIDKWVEKIIIKMILEDSTIIGENSNSYFRFNANEKKYVMHYAGRRTIYDYIFGFR